MKSTVLVTGATGFIGKKLIFSLLKCGVNVIALIRDREKLLEVEGCIPSLCDITDYEAVSETISRADVVIHLAGIVGAGPAAVDPYRTIDVNILGTLNVLDAARSFGKFVIFCGVGNFLDTSIYSIAQATSERFLLMYNEEFDTNTIPLRIFNAYGPTQNLKNGKLIINAISKGLRGDPITVFGDGSQLMDFIYIDDVVSSIMRAIELRDEHDGQPYHVGTTKTVSVLDATKKIVEFTGGNSKIVYAKARIGDNMGIIVANKERMLPGIDSPRSFEEGLQQTIEVFKGLT
jgi:UDP-glucose 4-epimerase